MVCLPSHDREASRRFLSLSPARCRTACSLSAVMRLSSTPRRIVGLVSPSMQVMTYRDKYGPRPIRCDRVPAKTRLPLLIDTPSLDSATGNSMTFGAAMLSAIRRICSASLPRSAAPKSSTFPFLAWTKIALRACLSACRRVAMIAMSAPNRLSADLGPAEVGTVAVNST